MPPKQLVDLTKVDLNKTVFGTDKIEEINPHRYEMRLIDRIVHFDQEDATIVATRNFSKDDFWVRGHIPGRPLVPGVLMIEAAAQMASFLATMIIEPGKDVFFGFAGIENVKFRNQVGPDDQLVLCGKLTDIRPRRFIFAAQGYVDGKMAFEATIVGMPV